MKLAAAYFLALVACCAASLPAQTASPPKYPATPRIAALDDVAGTQVPDPYRWLENAGGPDVRAWVAAENEMTASYMGQLPRRHELTDLLTRTADYVEVTAPRGGGERIFYFGNTGLENQSALYTQDRTLAPPQLIVDPNAFSRDGSVAIVDEAPSPDGRYAAYLLSARGSSWRTVRVHDVRMNQDLTDELHGIREGPVLWTQDNRGFFYVATDSSHTGSTPAALPMARQRVFYHRLGRPQSTDAIVYENLEHPEWRLHATLSEDGQYLVITLNATGDTRNRLYFIDLDNATHPNLRAPVVKLFDDGDALYEFVSSSGPLFYIRTSKGAPRTRVVAVDINSPDESHWMTIVHETYDPLIEVVRVDDRIVAHRLHDAHSVLELYSLSGTPRGSISLPGVGTVLHLSPRSDKRELYFVYTSFLQPPTAYLYDLETRSALPFRETQADSALGQYETTQLFFTSKDGTRVPLFITARRGITLDGSHAVLLSGYGSFGRANTPVYSPMIAAWLEQGGIYAVADVRGGGEYGTAWHDAAIGPHKQTAIDDFIGAAEFLIEQRYARARSLGIVGRGAGGTLVAAALTQRPDLFGAASIDDGLLDLIRYPSSGRGPEWTRELGSPENGPALRALLAYSPVHNARPGSYPPTLVTVAENDDVIPPFHGYKFVAALQAAQAAPARILLRAEPNIGHGPGVPRMRQLARDADRLVFLASALHQR